MDAIASRRFNWSRRLRGNQQGVQASGSGKRGCYRYRGAPHKKDSGRKGA